LKKMKGDHMPKIDYTAEKKAALEKLSDNDLKIIQKNYPVKRIRDAKIYEVLQMGFAIKIVAELSGFSYCHVWKIASFGTKKMGSGDLLKLRAAVAVFNLQIEKILNHDNGGN